MYSSKFGNIVGAALVMLLAWHCSPSVFAQKAKPSADELVQSGRYAEVVPGKDAHGQALYAFAQFYLAPSGKVYLDAWQAHEKGEVAGTFIAWQCLKNGIGVRYNEKSMWNLHFDLRTRLEKKADATPLE